MISFRDEFLSEEDLDLQSLTDDEIEIVWTAWLEQAQVTNEEDRYYYSHGVFTYEPVLQLTSLPRQGNSLKE